ncbi:MAG: DUF501 domain-containing protein [Corynebacteriales bacterium]|nr:DUF501 domain-containing protein [Mycobacteriales bacterium]
MCPQWNELPAPAALEPSETDLAIIAEQLGRPPRGVRTVAHHCPCGAPDVVRTEPRLPDGTPFPTTYYLTCPRAASEIGTLEAGGVMKEMSERLGADPELAVHYRQAHEDYLRQRQELGSVPEIDGVSAGGMPERVKCLHALVGHALAAGQGVNPIGDEALALLPRWWETHPCAAPLAAIDCGTNTVRLLIAQGAKTLVRRAEIVRLGEGVDASGRLAPAALERTRLVLEDYAAVLAEYGVKNVRMVATSATRDAANADEFATMVHEVLGVAPEVITGAQEAQLTFAGATSGLVGAEPPHVVVDIGGGSTEIIGGPGAAISVDIGCVRLTERFLRSDPPSFEELEELAVAVRAELRRVLDVVPAATLSDGGTLIGVAGTVTTLTALSQGLSRYESARVHGSLLDLAQVEVLLSELSAVSTAERVRPEILPAGRADVIVAGAVILREVMRAYQVKTIRASEHDILDGIVASLRR